MKCFVRISKVVIAKWLPFGESITHKAAAFHLSHGENIVILEDALLNQKNKYDITPYNQLNFLFK